MIEQITIKNFRQIDEENINLAPVTVIVGPNNSGKTSFLQAFLLLAMAIKIWSKKRLDNPTKTEQRTGVAINLSDLTNISATGFKELWQNTKTRAGNPDKKGTTSIPIKIYAKGWSIVEAKQQSWQVGFEFSYQRDSLIYTKPINGEFNSILQQELIGFLPSISGLHPQEDKLELGSILRRIGEGQTATVLRNICYHLYSEDKQDWQNLVSRIKSLFAISLNEPQHFKNSGLLELTYNEGSNKKMALSSLGSGAKQAILLFAYLSAFKNTIHLLDEPDAHLEVIKQANVYDHISDFAGRNNSQLIIVSHSESILSRAINKKNCVISSMFGKFTQEDTIARIKPTLSGYAYEEYLLAKQRPFILYCEGGTDLDFIRSFCKKLNKTNYIDQLDNSIYSYPINADQPNKAKQHFSALKEYVPELKGFALFDHLDKNFQDVPPGLIMYQWNRNEIENYIPIPDTLINYIQAQTTDLFSQNHPEILTTIIKNNTPPKACQNLTDAFWLNQKISKFLTEVFEEFFKKTEQPLNTMNKSKFYHLVDFINSKQINLEVKQTLDNIFTHLQ